MNQPGLVFEHTIPSREPRRLEEGEADDWIKKLQAIDMRFYNVAPQRTASSLLRAAAVARIDELSLLIGSANPEQRRAAISEAILRDEREVRNALAESSDPHATWTLWSMRGDPGVDAILAGWTSNPLAQKRQAAALFLGEKGVATVRALLEEMAKEELKYVVPRSGPGNRRVMGAVAWRGSARQILAKNYFRDDAARLRGLRLGARILANVDSQAARKVMHESGDSTDFYERKALMQVLGKVKPHAHTLPTLVKGITDEEAQVRIEAARSLAKVGDKSVVPALRKAYRNPPEPKPGTGRHNQALREILLALDALGGTLSADEAADVEFMKREGPRWR